MKNRDAYSIFEILHFDQFKIYPFLKLSHTRPPAHKHIHMDERRVLWNSRKIWNIEISALIGAAIS